MTHLPLCNDGGLMQNWCERQRELATEGRKTLKRHTDLHLRLDYEKKSLQLLYMLVITLMLAESLSFNFAIYWNCHYKSKMQECSKNYDAFSSSKRIVLVKVTKSKVSNWQLQSKNQTTIVFQTLWKYETIIKYFTLSTEIHFFIFVKNQKS